MTELERVIVLVEPEEKDALVAMSDEADHSMSKFMRKLLQKEIVRQYKSPRKIPGNGTRFRPSDFDDIAAGPGVGVTYPATTLDASLAQAEDDEGGSVGGVDE